MPLPADGNWNLPPYKTNCRVILYDNTEDEDYPPHWHTAIEIIMPLEGPYTVVYRETAYALREGDIFIVPSCEIHGLRVPPEARGGRRVIILFEPMVLCFWQDFADVVPRLGGINLVTPEAAPELHERCRDLLMEAYREFKKSDAYSGVSVYARIVDFYAALSRYHARRGASLKPFKASKRFDYMLRLNHVFEYIRDHLTEDLTLEKVAAEACFSKFHFARIFKEYTRMTLNQYLAWRRCVEAETLLADPNIPITDAAMRAGFESVTTFNHVFKRVKRCTPSEYRKTRGAAAAGA